MRLIPPPVGPRLIRLLFGLFLFGFGLGLMVVADLGLPAWEVLHQGIARNTPLRIGQAGIVVGFLVLIVWIPLRERPGPGTVANALLVGLFIDLTIAVMPAVTAPVWRWTLTFGGIVVVGLGSGFYIGAGLGPGPRDGLMTGIARRGPSLRLTRTLIEGSALAGGWLLGGHRRRRHDRIHPHDRTAGPVLPAAPRHRWPAARHLILRRAALGASRTTTRCTLRRCRKPWSNGSARR